MAFTQNVNMEIVKKRQKKRGLSTSFVFRGKKFTYTFDYNNDVQRDER